jgi:hypothetical protein
VLCLLNQSGQLFGQVTRRACRHDGEGHRFLILVVRQATKETLEKTHRLARGRLQIVQEDGAGAPLSPDLPTRACLSGVGIARQLPKLGGCFVEEVLGVWRAREQNGGKVTFARLPARLVEEPRLPDALPPPDEEQEGAASRLLQPAINEALDASKLALPTAERFLFLGLDLRRWQAGQAIGGAATAIEGIDDVLEPGKALRWISVAESGNEGPQGLGREPLIVR